MQATAGLRCRKCMMPISERDAVYLLADNKPSKLPACRECYEHSVRHQLYRKAPRRGFPVQRNPGTAQMEYDG
jgi:hypothetical protein